MMLIPSIKLAKKHYFWVLSLLFHLFFLAFFLVRTKFLIEEEHPALVIKSYAYNDRSEPLIDRANASKKITKIEPEKKGEIILPDKNVPETFPPPPPMTLSRNLQNPLRLIGNKEIEQSLFKVIGEALSYTLAYPQLAVDFRVKGRVGIGFFLHADGQVTGVQLLSSSGSGVLDNAALVAVKDISPIKGVGPFVKETRFLEIGIIFG